MSKAIPKGTKLYYGPHQDQYVTTLEAIKGGLGMALAGCGRYVIDDKGAIRSVRLLGYALSPDDWKKRRIEQAASRLPSLRSHVARLQRELQEEEEWAALNK